MGREIKLTKIQNPIIPGMAPDPSILRVGEDYYIATSTFHWKPAIQIFHSTDLANWQLLTYALDDHEIDLQGTNTPAGVWAPHLSYDAVHQKFWLAYCHIQNMAGREFNAESYIMSADQITGPWMTPRYLTSIGFDPSLFHDDDGKHYVAVLEWETRTGYQAPGHIVIAGVDLTTGKVGQWHRVTTGFTTRGCVEAPQIYKHGGYYYLLLASGGTGYAHGVEIGRAKEIFGPYEPDPTGEPIVTSAPHHLFSLGDPDAGYFEMYNPHSKLQKSGHGSLVETPDGQWYLAHLMSRPLLPADKVIMFHDGFAIDKWEEFFKGHHFENVVLDTHQYLMMAEIRNHDLSVAAYQKTMTDFGKKIAQVNQYVPVVTGEWSLFNSYTAGVDTNGGINPTQQEFNDAVRLDKEKLQKIYQALWKTQVDAWNQGIGYIYWTYKLNIDTINEPSWYGWDCWALQRVVDKDWLDPCDI